jgi:hypothetical protein
MSHNDFAQKMDQDVGTTASPTFVKVQTPGGGEAPEVGLNVQALWLNVGDDIAAALATITDSSLAKPYAVYLNPGVYSIGDNVLTLPAYVSLQGLTNGVILDYTGNTTQEAVFLASGSKIQNVAIQNHLSSAYAIDIDVAGSYIVDDVSFINVTSCLRINNASARVTVRQPVFLPFSQPMAVGIKIESGDAVIYNVRTGGAAALTDLVWTAGSGTHAHVLGLFSEVPGVVNGIRCSDSSELEASEVIVKQATKGAFIESGGHLAVRAGIFNDNAYGIDNTGSGSTFEGYNVGMLGNTVANYAAGAATISRGYGITDPDTFAISPEAILQASFLSLVEGDESWTTLAELHVGSPGFPRESAFGGGDSYVNGMLVYTYDDGSTAETGSITVFAEGPVPPGRVIVTSAAHGLSNGDRITITGTTNYNGLYEVFGAGEDTFEIEANWLGDDATGTWTNTGYIDKFTEASSPDSSTFAMGADVNDALYLGSRVPISASDYHRFFGIKFLTTVAAVLGSGDMVAEYWNGSAWTAFNTMTCQSAVPYYRQGSKMFTATAGNYQMTFDPYINTDWTANDPVTLGTNYYWVRFRVTTATITTPPTFEQIKLHTNRTELNADGYREMFGNARAYEGFPVFWNSFQDVQGVNVADQELHRSTNCRAAFLNNDFTSVGLDVGAAFPLPRWVDTSAPLKVEVVIIPEVGGTPGGDEIEFTAYLNSSKAGTLIRTSTTGTTTAGEVSQAVNKVVTNGLQETYEFELDISDKGEEGAGVPAELLWLNLKLTALTGDATGAYGASFLVKALRFRDGEHV